MIRPSLLARFLALGLLALARLQAQDTTLAGWTFSQFLGTGAPAVNGLSFATTNFIVATYRGDFTPLTSEVDGQEVIFNSEGYTNPAIGSWSFGNFDFNNGEDVIGEALGSLNVENSTTLDGKNMALSDVAGMGLRFNVAATLWDVQVTDTLGYANAGVSDFTYAARGNGGEATVEWLFDGEVFATSVINASTFSTYNYELPAGFYGNGLIQGRLVTGSVTFDNVQFNGQLGTPPTFTQNPVGLVRLVGESATFSVTVTGATNPTYVWKKGGTPISGATNASFTIPSVALNDAATYTVTVRSSNGITADSDAAILEVRQAPAITQQPADNVANPGQNITFTAVATGSPAPTFVWQRGGVDLVDGGRISGSRTASLSIANAVVEDSGEYRVKITNAVETILSRSATLQVSALEVAPTVSTPPADTTVVEGADA